MRGILKKLPEQAVRIIIVFIVLAGALFVVWQFLLPPELKEKELQKTATLEREAAREVKYAGAQACGECHDKESNMKKGGYHRDLTCESCHGAAQKHVDNPTGVKPSSPKKRDYCSFCHNYNSSRPSGFPQINPVTHNPRKPCIACHNPHNPAPPKVPRSCNACHAQIERTKAASYHALLQCTVCHATPEKHKTLPRTVRPTKPDTRAFCGKCHDKSSRGRGAPAVDMATHGEKYVCWQCHYPHMLGGI
jgi:ribosomal protein S27AE